MSEDKLKRDELLKKKTEFFRYIKSGIPAKYAYALARLWDEKEKLDTDINFKRAIEFAQAQFVEEQIKKILEYADFKNIWQARRHLLMMFDSKTFSEKIRDKLFDGYVASPDIGEGLDYSEEDE